MPLDFNDVDSTRQRRTGHRQAQIQGPHIDRNLKRELGLEPIDEAGGTRVCLLRRLLAEGRTELGRIVSKVAPTANPPPASLPAA
jgi:hypothetical protein